LKQYLRGGGKKQAGGGGAADWQFMGVDWTAKRRREGTEEGRRIDGEGGGGK